MDAAQLRRMAPGMDRATAERWLPFLVSAMEKFSIATPARQACFLAQVLHESGGLQRLSENLNYRPDALLALFRGRFTADQAKRYGFIPGVQQADQEMVANIAYAGRYGNGPIHSGDGYRYRGRGPLQVTFRDNYAACGKAVGLDLVKKPELLLQPEAGSLSAAWYWARGNPTGKSLNSLADAGAIAAISKAINGGDNGLADRLALSRHALDVLEGRVPA